MESVVDRPAGVGVGAHVDELATVRDCESGFTLKLIACREAGSVRFRLGLVAPSGQNGTWSEWLAWRQPDPIEHVRH